jgi:hypothetical protein
LIDHEEADSDPIAIRVGVPAAVIKDLIRLNDQHCGHERVGTIACRVFVEEHILPLLPDEDTPKEEVLHSGK